MEINIPTIEQKYITLFETQQGYDDAQPDFIEVNWSAVKDTEHPEEVETEYYPSTRQTHGYEPVDGDKVKPDAAHKSLYYTYDHILKTFFLEIIWGYYGWEWVDYEYTDPDTQETATLKGGNLYKVKEITEVPSIPDGYRLEHINNFLNSQDKVTHVCWFDTSNIKSMKNAFKYNGSSVPSTAFLEVDITNFPEVTESDNAFYARRLRFNNNNLNFPELKSLNHMFEYTYFENLLDFKINAPLLENMDYAFYYGAPLNGVPVEELNINVNSLFNNGLQNVSSMQYAFAHLYLATDISVRPNIINFSLNLTGSTIDANDVINLSHLLEYTFPKQISSSQMNIDLDFNNPVILTYAFAHTTNPILTLHNKEALISDISYGFASCNFMSTSVLLYTKPFNSLVNDSYLFKGSNFYGPVSYDFSPNGEFKNTYAHFTKCTFYYDTPTFINIDRLLRVDFSGISLRINNIDLNFVWTVQLYNSNYTYPKGVAGIDNEATSGDTDFKYRYIALPRKTEISNQTFYTNNSNVCNSVVSFSNLNIHFLRNVSFYNDVLVSTPNLYSDSNYYPHLEFEGKLLENIYFTSAAVTKYYSGGSPVNGSNFYLSARNVPALVNLYITGKVNPKTFDLTGQYNLNVSVFEDFISQQDVIDTLIIQQRMYDLLTSTCKATLLNICNTINLIQESNE